MTATSSASSLGAAIGVARARWPGVTISDAVLEASLRDRAPALEVLLGRAAVPDLVLCIAGLHGDPAAIGHLDRAIKTAVAEISGRMALDAAARDEVTQRLRARLLVAVGDAPPKLSTFEGEGPLGAWIRVCAVREALMMRRAERPHEPDSDVIDVVTACADPELEMIKGNGRAVLKDAFHTAFSRLTPRQRALLAYSILDGLTLQAIGKIYGVDPSTISRWISKTREALATLTREAVQDAFSIQERTFDQIVDLACSRIDLSITRLLEAGREAP